MSIKHASLTEAGTANLGTDSIETLYKEHNHWLVTWLRKKLSCPDNAADISQDTFVRILKCRNALLNMHNPRAYLARTAHNLIIDRARRESLERAYLQELTATLQDNDSVPSTERVWQAIEALEQISLVLEKFPKHVQKTFLLYFIDNMKQSEIAKQLKISTRTVRNYIVQVLVYCQRLGLD